MRYFYAICMFQPGTPGWAEKRYGTPGVVGALLGWGIAYWIVARDVGGGRNMFGAETWNPIFAGMLGGVAGAAAGAAIYAAVYTASLPPIPVP
jgi:hypothetical protein